ncbi:tetratricopeptide repeat-containing sensor histidine kinase [Hanstruepera marina]|uniref:tetratricopeptide repeat-containing sensor histidine kinase n=1 Tax=Hanstruepera marina TaxID=2873265 RepID=UPI001CA7B533|nr:tetratricopeptide repeat protein [Hanstruepera marina]
MHQCHKYQLILKIALFSFSLILGLKGFTQPQSKSKFIALVDSILVSKTSDYREINTVFRGTTKDTVKMNYLLKRSLEANYNEGASYALNKLGETYRNISNYQKAIESHKDAFEYAKNSNSIELEVRSLNMLGVVYRRMDAIRSALDYHKEALDIAESQNNPSLEIKYNIAVSQNSMGNIYLALKQYNLALDQFNKSLQIELEMDNKLGLAINNQNIGYAKEKLGSLNEALSYYEKSLKYNNEINSKIGQVICYNSIGKVYIQKEAFKKSEAFIKDALKKALEINDQYYISTSYLNLGLLQLKQQDYNNAQINLNKALEISKNFNLKSTEIETYLYLSELYDKIGDPEKAFTLYKKHVVLDETLTNERNLQYVNDLIIKYESEKKNSQIKALANENEIVKLKLAQNKRTLILSLLGGCLALIILFVLNRQRQLKNDKKIVTLEQEMLRNQMNPHFIFNSLNSIKLYIINNEKENAVYYLNKFSKLIRKILVASNEKEISLEDELETMSLYINIENIRFSNAIDYNVIIDDSINPALIKVPSLIFQPFLENAIWHGLSSKAENKKISLHVKSDNPNYVTITITDNGIGRVASKKIKETKKLKRKSLGIQITRARLENFSKNYTYDYDLKINDLYESGNAIGTQVVVNIPTKINSLKIA